MITLRYVSSALALVALFSANALALCADVTGDAQVTAVDALSVLNTAVGQPAPLQCSCEACGTSNTSPEALAYCADVSADGQVTALDALATLNIAVGQEQPFSCSCDACAVVSTTTSTTTTSSTTTTTVGGCPQPDALNERIYKEIYTCAESSGGGARYCDVSNAEDSIRFEHVSGGEYEVRDVPDTGFVYNGTLTCRTFDWTALSPGDYTEAGTWTFAPDLESFAGSSTYVALDDSYEGECNTTGAKDPNSPPNPTPVPPCP
jgi:hypothetical protein